MALILTGDPAVGGSGADFILVRGSSVQQGGDGDDLVLGDMGFLANGYGLDRDDAYDLEASPDGWTVSENPLFADWTVPHRTAFAAPQAGDSVWYSFAAAEGAILTVDIDSWGGSLAGSAPLVVRLVDATGAVRAESTGGAAGLGGLGSQSDADAFLAVAVPSTGTWFIQVLEADTGDGGLFDGDEAFLVNLSVSGHAVGSDPFAAGADSIDGGAGNDLLMGGAGNDTIHGGTGDDFLSGGSGDDLLLPGEGACTMDGGTGRDTASWAAASAGVHVNIPSGSVSRVELFILSGHDDTFSGGQAGEEVHAYGGSDGIFTSGGNDRIVLAGGGLHHADGGAGNDTIAGDAGGDTLSGASGNDLIAAGDDADLIQGGGGNDSIDAGAGDDDVSGNGNNDTISGGAGADTLRGGLGLDDLSGDDGDDWLQGDAGADTILGGDGNDTLLGGQQIDMLDGGAGNDTLTGGQARDVLSGGGGADLFVWNVNDFGTTLRGGADRITDFSQADGDRIDLSVIDASTTAAGNNAFTWIGNGAFSGAGGQLRYLHEAGNTYVEGDRNGDGAADFAIRLDGIINLTASDFAL